LILKGGGEFQKKTDKITYSIGTWMETDFSREDEREAGAGGTMLWEGERKGGTGVAVPEGE
jgi:hypothetical protein